MNEKQRHILKNIILYILKNFPGGTDYIRLYKIMYFAHKEQLAAIGIPMIPDNFKAWQYGPVPSFTGSVIKHLENKEPLPADMEAFGLVLNVRKNKRVSALADPESTCLPEYSRSLLDKYIVMCRNRSSKNLSEESHDNAWFSAYYKTSSPCDGHTSLRSDLIARAGGASDDIVGLLKLFTDKDKDSWNARNVTARYVDTAAGIYRLLSLKDDWDGEGAFAVKQGAAFNCRRLISRRSSRIDLINDIYPTPTGNICIDWQNGNNRASAEIGEKRMAFYFVCPDHEEVFDSPGYDFCDHSCETLYGFLSRLSND